jgi:hypothetical protein
MSGTHRGTTQSPVASVVRSIVWMLQLAGAVAALLVVLAVLVFVCDILFTRPPRAWPLPIGVACGISVCIFAIGNIVWHRMQRGHD